MRKSAIASIALLSEFIESDEIGFAVQRIHPVQSNDADGPWFEWLLRLAPEHGAGEPDFIAAVESLELSLNLDRRIVRDAFQWLLRQPRDTRLSVRISGASFADRGFTDMLAQTFETRKLSPQQLCFDLDIDAVARNLGRATRFVRSMGDLGCTVAVNCDVAGDPMLALLAPLGIIDYLKIERKWVTSAPTSDAHRVTLQGICNYGKRLGLKLISKGVDGEPQLKLIAELGVDYYLGLMGGEPRPVALLGDADDDQVRYGHSA